MREQRLALLILIAVKTSNLYSWNFPKHDFCAADTRLSYLFDPNSKLTATETLNLLRSKAGLVSPQNLSYGYTKGTVWPYLKVKQAEVWQKCILELANPQLGKIDIFEVAAPNDALKEIAQLGDGYSFSERFYRVRNYVFPFRADRDQEFLLSLKSTATMTVPIKIQWRDQYISDSSRDYLLLGLFYGIMIFFIFFGFHSFVSFGNRGYLIYTLFAASILLFFIDRDGIAFQYLWSGATEWKMRSVRVIAAITMALGVLYYSQILRVERKTLYICYLYVALCALLVVALVWLDPGKTNRATILISLGTPLLMVFLPLSLIKR